MVSDLVTAVERAAVVYADAVKVRNQYEDVVVDLRAKLNAARADLTRAELNADIADKSLSLAREMLKGDGQ